MIAPNSTLGRAISLGLLVVLIGLVWFAMFAPMVGTINEKTQTNEDQVERYQKLLSLVERGMPDAKLADIQNSESLIASSRAGAQASLQRLARTLALSQGVNVRSISGVPATDDTESTVSILVSAETDMEALVNFLYRVNAHQTYMWAADMKVQSNNWRNQNNTRKARLELRITIVAPWQTSESETL